MSLYLIGYDLNYPEQKYDNLIGKIMEDIATKEENYWHDLGSTWIVKSAMATHEIFKLLRSQIDKDDELLVIRLPEKSECAWFGPLWTSEEWLRKHLPSIFIDS